MGGFCPVLVVMIILIMLVILLSRMPCLCLLGAARKVNCTVSHEQNEVRLSTVSTEFGDNLLQHYPG